MRRTGGGRFDPADRNLYFLAGEAEVGTQLAEDFSHWLVAVNELKSDRAVERLERLLDTGMRVLMDSGVYATAMEHAKAHGISHNAALRLAPEAIDGFGDLLERYVDLARRYGDRLWGYVEIDFGGVEGKRRTRSHLESLGLSPIPVYHPLGDGWAYFDELAAGYDRVCLGNIVQASQHERIRLLTTVAERKAEYPGLWIHGLGLTPNWMSYVYPMDSCDSSSWQMPVRNTTGYIERGGPCQLGALHPNFKYRLQSTVDAPDGHFKGIRMGAYGMGVSHLNWREWIAERDGHLAVQEAP